MQAVTFCWQKLLLRHIGAVVAVAIAGIAAPCFPEASAATSVAATADAVSHAELAAREAGKLLDDGKLSEAEARVEHALVAALATLGEKHAATLDLLDVKAEIFLEQARYDDCVRMRVREVVLRKEVNGAEDLATLTAMSNLAVALTSAGRHSEGVNAFNSALTLQRRVLGDSHAVTVNTVGDLASAQLRAGMHADALRNYELGYQLRSNTLGPKNPKTLISLANYAHGLVTVGRADEAEPLSFRAWQLRREVLGAAHYDTAVAQNNYAALLERLGRTTEATSHYREAAQTFSASLGPTNPSALKLRSNYAVALFRQSRSEQSLVELREILQGLEQTVGPSHPHALDTRYHIATVLASLGRWSDALIEFERTHAGRAANASGVHPDVLSAVYSVGVAHAALGDRLAALKTLREMQPQLDEGRVASGALSAAAARTWQRTFVGTLGTLIELEIASGRGDEAFNLLERSKARVLLAQMGEQQAARNAGLPDADVQRLAELTRSLSDATAKAALTKSGPEREALSILVTNGAGQLADARASLAAAHPKFKQLTDLKIATSAAAETLPADTAFLSYSVQADSTIRAVVLDSSGTLHWHDLGRLPAIDRMAEALRLIVSQTRSIRGVYTDDAGRTVRIVRWWTDGNPRWRTVTEARLCTPDESQVDANRSAGTARSKHLLASMVHSAPEPNCVPVGAEAIKGTSSDRAEISEALTAQLLSPLASNLVGKRRWLISPDAALWAIPWDVLPWQGAALAARIELTLTHSLSVYNIVQQRLEQPVTTPDNRRDLLAFGDPSYANLSASETRRLRGVAGRALTSNTLLRSPLRSSFDGPDAERLIGSIAWPRLPYSRLEAQLAAKHFSPTSVDLMLGDAASERQLRALDASGKLASYRNLLFSVHGFFDPTLPEHSSLVLVGDAVVGGDTRHDGLVSLNEMLSMRLASDLTVLSACNTAMGKTVNADGLVGLSYALLVAGNANTIATLWPVSDRETAHFIDRLFANIKAGAKHSAALAKTKREFINHPNAKLRDPRYWAAFVFFGA